jgi:tRNA G26 N,N-dimethylase Trm1
MPKTLNTCAADQAQERTESAELRTRKSSKLDLIAERLSAPMGTTLEELMTATGWQSHSVRASMTGLRKQGHNIVRTTGNGVTRFAIAAPGSTSTEA